MRRQIMYFLGIIGLAILLSGVLSYNTFGNQMVKSEFGPSFSAEESRQGLEILKGMRTGDTEWLGRQITAELVSLRAYANVLEIERRGFRDYGMPVYTEDEKKRLQTKYTLSSEQAESRIHMLEYLEHIAIYCSSYGDYNTYVQKQADKLMSISVFSDVNQESIRKTGRDFTQSVDIQPVPILTLGITLFLNSNFSGYIMILTAILCAWVILNPLQKNDDIMLKKGTNVWLSGILLVGFIAVALAQYQTVRMLWGMDELSVPIQSIPGFKTCRYNITIGALILIQTAIKCIGGLIIFWLSEAVFCMQRRLALGVAAGFAIFMMDHFVLKEWLFRAFFACDKIIGIYHNRSLLGFVFSEAVIWVIVISVITVLAIFLANSQLSKLVLFRKEKNEQKYYAEINDRYNEIRALRHDINNHLSAVSYLLEEGRVEEAKKYLDGIGSELQDTRLPEKTGIDALDMILWRKLSQAKDKDIKIHLDIRESLRNTSLSDFELCSLFGNMIDNAVEAVLKLETNRDIRLQIVRQMDMVCIFCENPYQSITKENGRLVTSKSDFKNHGLGIRQMEHIAAKHGGTVHVSTENNLFTISILLQVNEA